MVSSLALQVEVPSRVRDALSKRKCKKDVNRWHVGTAGHHCRLVIAGSTIVLLAVIFVGYYYRRDVAFASVKLQDFTSLFALNVLFEIMSEVWLDWARMKIIKWFQSRQQHDSEDQSTDLQSTTIMQTEDLEDNSSASMIASSGSTSHCNAASVVFQVNSRREEFHKQRVANGQIATFPYTGPQCWHWETSECIREVNLGIGLTALYLVNQDAFRRFWDVAVISLYATDMLFLLTRWSHISPRWLSFILLHHILCFCCLTFIAFAWKVEPPAQLRALVLSNLSNSFVAMPVIFRSFTGYTETFYVAGFCFLGQRSLRWGGIIALAVDLAGDDLYTANVVVSFLATASVELLDIPVQWKKLWHQRQ